MIDAVVILAEARAWLDPLSDEKLVAELGKIVADLRELKLRLAQEEAAREVKVV